MRPLVGLKYLYSLYDNHVLSYFCIQLEYEKPVDTLLADIGSCWGL